VPSHPALSSTFKSLTTTPSKATILNSCPYAIFILSVPGQNCGPQTGPSAIPPHSTWSETVLDCPLSGNTAVKIYKADPSTTHSTQDENPPLQFEYGKKAKLMWYDISFIDCEKRLGGNKGGLDFTNCATFEGGMQFGPGVGCVTVKCEAGGDCCKSAYCDPYGEAARKASGNEPTAGCTPEVAGTTWEAFGTSGEVCAER
jgi:hypothetical protein